MDKKIRQEDPAAADDYRQRYVDGIAAYVRQMNEECKMSAEGLCLRKSW